MKHFQFTFLDKITFYLSYIYYRFVTFLFEIKQDRLKLLTKNFLFFLEQISGKKTDLIHKIDVSYVVSKFGKFKIRPSTEDVFFVMPFFERQDVNHLRDLVSKQLEEKKRVLFLDIGADIGTYSVQIGNTFSKKIEIIGFEPSKSSYNILKENIESNRIDADVRNCALYDYSGKGYLNFNELVPGNSNIVSDGNDYETIEIKTLDSVIPKGVFEDFDTIIIKMDIEGGEVSCLKGCYNLLNSGKETFLLVEDFVDRKIVEYLPEIGFEFIVKKTPYNSWWYKKTVSDNLVSG